MDITFKDSKDFTVGIELEIQLVDSETFALTQTSSDVIGTLEAHKDSVKHELMMSNLEIISRVCSDIPDAEEDLKDKVRSVICAASVHDTLLCCASTHPFSKWREQKITEDPRYLRLKSKLQMVARRFNIFGLHVHVGVDGGERCIYIMNKMLYYLPHLLAISSNSPFWEGDDSGLKSFRTKVFEGLPIAGLPFYFNDWQDYARLVNNYLATGTIETIRELWWDIRPHPDFGTIEVRVCDIPPSIGEILSLASLIQALVKKFSDDYDRSVPFVRPHSAITRENKWRACRYGLDGEFINKDGSTTISAREAVASMVDSVAAEAESLGSAPYLQGIRETLAGGTGADRQLEIYSRTGRLADVVAEFSRSLAAEVGS